MSFFAQGNSLRNLSTKHVKLQATYSQFLFLILLFGGTVFFIPPIFVNRFFTSPALWMQVGIGIGLIGCVLFTKSGAHVPPKAFILLLFVWAIYHAWQSRGNVNNLLLIVVLLGAFFLFHVIWNQLSDKKIAFVTFTLLGMILSLWGLGQAIGLVRSFHGSFRVTGPFDNPAGISASLAILLPFALYNYCQSTRKYLRVLFMAVACLILGVIMLSKARAAILAATATTVYFLVHIARQRGVTMRPVHHLCMIACCLLFLVGLFFMKKDSANGRLLIWRCTGELIAEKPLFGHGSYGFTSRYMDLQASYFLKYPDSQYAMLADNVRHPFNEFLKWAANYGIIGLCLTLLLIILPPWASRGERSAELFAIRLSLLSVGICAFFSYPFNYPFVRLVTVALIAFALASNPGKSVILPNGYITKGVTILLACGLLYGTARQAQHEREWHVIANKSLRGETVQMLPRYESLYTRLKHNDLFLYNYAAELNHAGKHAESQKVAFVCDSLWSDYDLQMVMANNCQELNRHREAEGYLKKAAAMCPVKFIPLYQLMQLYQETNQDDKARALAHIIVEKESKVPSPIVSSIKNKMRSFLNETEHSSE